MRCGVVRVGEGREGKGESKAGSMLRRKSSCVCWRWKGGRGEMKRNVSGGRKSEAGTKSKGYL